ncbi:hypothetical protein FIBSPDRAFT_969949 [Athelia psychrophila]|uniref:Uncharacterized protein n=1 Tax=Athelia psychrophila TaxID=1759441 RepID=A0A167T1V8_9AGAM|nr:hypothetical protein FIBSPDRAFT_969949 [Fibularhizoctonia sp. CBS 109695]
MRAHRRYTDGPLSLEGAQTKNCTSYRGFTDGTLTDCPPLEGAQTKTAPLTRVYRRYADGSPSSLEDAQTKITPLTRVHGRYADGPPSSRGRTDEDRTSHEGLQTRPQLSSRVSDDELTGRTSSRGCTERRRHLFRWTMLRRIAPLLEGAKKETAALSTVGARRCYDWKGPLPQEDLHLDSAGAGVRNILTSAAPFLSGSRMNSDYRSWKRIAARPGCCSADASARPPAVEMEAGGMSQCHLVARGGFQSTEWALVAGLRKQS